MKLRRKLLGMGKAQFFDVILPQIRKYLNDRRVEAVISGSVSFGYCDKYSDVDGVIFLSKRDYMKYGKFFNESIKDLKVEREGHRIEYHFTTIDEYCVTKLLRSDSEDAWREASPFGLYAVSKFIIIHDPGNRIRKLQQRVRKYYPEKVWRDNILKHWRSLLEDGKYNIERDLKRKKVFMFNLHLCNALWNIIILGFLFNKKYYPTHHQWLYEEFKKLPKVVPEVIPKIDEIVRTASIETRAKLLSEIINIYMSYVRDNKLIKPEYVEEWWKIPWR